MRHAIEPLWVIDTEDVKNGINLYLEGKNRGKYKVFLRNKKDA